MIHRAITVEGLREAMETIPSRPNLEAFQSQLGTIKGLRIHRLSNPLFSAEVIAVKLRSY
jgi:hypothetical protein